MPSADRMQSPTVANSCDVKSREVRLGLVMYGGVSLAIYINGVAGEFFRAVKGQGVYRLIKAMTDSDIVVDIISGTSAGGINGILLAYALCNDRNFCDTAVLWRRAGGIMDLLRDPRDAEESHSLLDSRGYYQQELEKAFRHMGRLNASGYGGDPSRVSELDLFVTGTDVYGNVYTEFDDAGHAIDVKDHRTVFLLQHRKGRKEQFSASGEDGESTIRALAKLARITSCFPAAFEPVHVTLGEEPEDELLQNWGRIGKEAYFLDGGVLDNKPFTYTLRQIYFRTAERPVERKLFYVEPDPESFRGDNGPRELKAPNFFQSILTSVVGIPQYESIADDLRALAEHNDKVEQYSRLVRHIRPDAEPARGEEARELHRRSRLIFLCDRVIEGLFKKDGRRRFFVGRERETARELVKGLDEGLLAKDAEKIFKDFDVYYRLRRLFRVTYLIYDLLYEEMGDGSSNGERRTSYRSLLEVFNRQIGALEIVRSAMEGLIEGMGVDDLAELDDNPGEVWNRVRHRLYRLLDAAVPPMATLPPDFIPAEHDPREGGSWLPQEVLTSFHEALRDHSKAIVKQWKKTPSVSLEEPQSLLPLLDRWERTILDHFLPEKADPVRCAYETFESLDALLFPIELTANLHEKDRVEIVRISPVDAQQGFSNCGFSDKVSGDAFYHFGGFFKRSWRSNDILWGRLDGLCQLVETLLDRKRLEALLAQNEARDAIRSRFFEQLDPPRWRSELDPAVLFPHAGSETHKRCRLWLESLFLSPSGTRPAALDEPEFSQMVELMIEAAQLEVIREDFPKVIVDAQMEEDEWNVFNGARGSKGQEAARPSSNPSAASSGWESATLPGWSMGKDVHHDPLVSAFDAMYEDVTAKVKEMDQMDSRPESPSKTAFGRFFNEAHRVGSERIERHIPLLVLLEILATALLVARNCVMNVFGKRADRVKGNPFYFFGLDLPLRGFHRFVLLARRSSRMGFGAFVALLTVCIALLVFGIVFRHEVVWVEPLFSLRLVVFFIAPLLGLIAALLYLKVSRKLRRGA